MFWYKAPVKLGYIPANYDLGTAYCSGSLGETDIPLCIKHFRTAADGGYVDAMADLGAIYAAGKWVPQDYAEAFKWTRQAADKGSPYGQLNLGIAYAQGLGVLQDYAEAAVWYRKSAMQKNAEAFNRLGILYADGSLGAPNKIVAYALFNLGAAAGGVDAAQNRDKILASMSKNDIVTGQTLAREMNEP